MKVLPIDYGWYCRVQKCYLSDSCFNNELRPGCWMICTMSDKSEVICRAFMHSRRIFSQNLAYMDQSVVRNTFENSQNIEMISYQKIDRLVDFADPITIDVTVRDISFPGISKKTDLVEVVKNILMMYKFSAGCTIHLNIENLIPISTVQVISCRETGIGSITSTNDLNIRNIFFQDNRVQRNDPFLGYADIEDCLSEIFIKNSKQMSHREKFPPSNEILLIGSSGTGKTTLIEHFVRKFQCNHFRLDPLNFHGEYPGESEEKLEKFQKTILDMSKDQKDCLSLISIDDIDVICPRDSGPGERNKSDKLGPAVLNLLEKVSGARGVILIATVKDITYLSSAARRKGRLEIEIFLRNPSKGQRKEISKELLKNCTRNQFTIEQITELSSWIAQRTSGFVGSDIRQLIQKTSYVKSQDHLLELLQKEVKTMRLSLVKCNNLLVESDSVDFDDLGGLEALKRTIEVSIVAPLKNFEAFERMGIEVTKGILLYGPPGCAKTTIVRALARKTHMPLLAISPAQVYSPYVGDSERFLTKAFQEARICAPSILFIDELDALVGCRQLGRSSDVQSRILAVFLTSLDGIGRRIEGASDGNVLVIAATNRPDVIDEALLRPGRFDKLIHVPPPQSSKDRMEILLKITEKMPLRDVNLQEIAEKTQNFSGADLRSLCQEAALHRLTRDLSAKHLIHVDFTESLHEMRPSLTESQIAWYGEFEQKGKVQ
ncbi:ATPase, AAA-type, conserved site [Sergentomyia squamirostris]